MLGAAAVTIGMLLGSQARAASVSSATVSVDSTVDFLGDGGRSFTFTIANTGNTNISGATIQNPSGAQFTVTACPSPPPGWTATANTVQCNFSTTSSPILPGQSRAFGVRVSSLSGNVDRASSFRALLRSPAQSSLFIASPSGGIAITAYAWEITGAIIVGSPAPVAGACPPPVQVAPKNQPINLAICGRNRTLSTAAPTTGTLGGTFVSAPGTWTAGPIPPGGAASPPVVLGNWTGVATTNGSGLKSVIVSVASTPTATSPPTTFDGFSTNQPPVAVDDGPYSVNEDGTVTVVAPGVLSNDADPDGDAVTVKLPAGTSSANGGSVNLSASGGFTYLPAVDFNGTDTFEYQATDGQSDSNTATVTITVNSVNDAPSFTKGADQTVTEDAGAQSVSGWASAISPGPPDEASQSVTFTATNDNTALFSAQPAVAADGTLTYTPAANANGAAIVNVSLTDTGTPPATSAAQTFTISVTAVNDAPTVVNDNFAGAVGNTAFGVGTAPPQPSVGVTGTVLTNDSDGDGPGPLTAGPTNITSTGGGLVTMNSDGTFTYVPPAGVKNTNDTFTYTLSDGGGGTSHGTVTITIRDALVWYANNALGVNGAGTSVSPFNTLANLRGAGDADGPGDVIFLFTGSGQYTGGLPLEARERLIGQPEDLVVGATTVWAGIGTNPTITNSAGNGIDLANDVVIRRVSVADTSAQGITGGTITNADIGPELSVTNSIGAGFSIDGPASGTVTMAGSVRHTSGAAPSIRVKNRVGGLVTISGAVDDSGGGVSLSGNSATTVSFTGVLTISTNTNTAFSAVAGGTVSANNPANTIATTGNTALDLELGTTIGGGLTFRSINSSGGNSGIILNGTGSSGGLTVTGSGTPGSGGTIGSKSGPGIALINVNGPVSLTDMATTNVSGTDVMVQGGSGDVIYTGTIANTAGASVVVSNKVIPALVNFSGAITDNGGSGIDLNSNTGAQIRFAGGLALSTGANPAFKAAGGGTVNVTGSNNSLATTTGTALTIDNTTIGASNVTFKSITAGTAVSGPANGIVLHNTGSSGHLVVAGNGTNVGATGGGVIQRTTGDAISLADTRDVSLNGLSVNNTGRHGIFGTGVTNLTVSNSDFVTIGNADEEDGFYFRTTGANNISGALTVANVHLEAFVENGIGIINNSGQLTVSVTDSEFVNNDDTFGESAILAQAVSGAGLNLNVSTSAFDNIEAAAIRWLADGTGTFDANVSSNTITNQGGPNNFPTTENIVVSTRDQNTVTFDITGNQISNAIGDGIVVVGDGNVQGRIDNNTIGGETGAALGDGVRLDMDGVFGAVINSANFVWTVQVNSNTINLGGTGDDGVQILNRDNIGTMNVTVANNSVSNTVSEAVRYTGGERNVPPLGDTDGHIAILNNVLTNTSTGSDRDLVVATTDSAVACSNISGNTKLSGTFDIDFSEAETSTQSVTQSSLAAVSSSNAGANVTNSVGALSFSASCTVATPANP
jgi:hypothetical protein